MTKLLRARECGCVWSGRRDGMRCRHNNLGYEPSGSEYAWLTFRAGQILMAKTTAAFLATVAAVAAALAVVATPIVALAVAGYPDAAWKVGFAYGGLVALAAFGWLVGVLYYD